MKGIELPNQESIRTLGVWVGGKKIRNIFHLRDNREYVKKRRKPKSQRA